MTGRSSPSAGSSGTFTSQGKQGSKLSESLMENMEKREVAQNVATLSKNRISVTISYAPIAGSTGAGSAAARWKLGTTSTPSTYSAALAT
eukprot:CAMPEP_0170480008 /NCGR_PEP_ID=MMETSP0208-20121228/1011_1 /TAXON_ID=197538 /ORGANISM="Strombidium inclinatum, Strain S3" /LENGTH=89 /DNA_ID=CAMNT_0010752479 /DNA_START=532 /DNA_END=801 /DNA_ORIENTATION=-